MRMLIESIEQWLNSEGRNEWTWMDDNIRFDANTILFGSRESVGRGTEVNCWLFIKFPELEKVLSTKTT